MTFFAVLLKSISVGCNNLLLPSQLAKSADVNCLTYEANKERYNDNLCLLRAVCMHKTVTEKLGEETSKFLDALLGIKSKLSIENFRRVALEDIHVVEDLANVNILVYDIEVSENGNVGELVPRSFKRFNSTATLLRYNNHLLCH